MEPWFTQGLHISQQKIKNNAFKILIDSNGIGRTRNKKNQLTCPFQLSNNNFLDIQFRHDKNKYSHGSPKSFISQLKKIMLLNFWWTRLVLGGGETRRINRKGETCIMNYSLDQCDQRERMPKSMLLRERSNTSKLTDIYPPFYFPILPIYYITSSPTMDKLPAKDDVTVTVELQYRSFTLEKVSRTVWD